MAIREMHSFDQPNASRGSFLSNLPRNHFYNQFNTISMELVFESEDSKDSIEEDNYTEEDNDDNSITSNLSNQNSLLNLNESFIDHTQTIPSLHQNLLNDDDSNPVKPRLTQSASACQLNPIDNFKSSHIYRQLDLCCIYGNKMLCNRIEGRYDIDTEEGKKLCDKLLNQIATLFHLFKLKEENRDYRNDFPATYLDLFKDASFCYLSEILDSAQEDTPHYIVNGETFQFTQEVLEDGRELFKAFNGLIEYMNHSLMKIKEEFRYEKIKEIKAGIAEVLQDFDKKWVIYEERIINEIINIERLSRRYIFEGIRLEKELMQYELRANVKGRIIFDDKEYNRLREQFITVIIELNKVANTEGKGRDDLQIDILFKAERVLRQVSDSKSRGMRNLAQTIKKSFFNIRQLFRQYDQCVDAVNPQLRNNPELVDALYDFEVNWEKGNEYLMDQMKYHQLLSFSQTIEIIKEKYANYQISEMIDSSDPTIFLSLPSIIILQSLSENKQLDVVKDYIPDIVNPDEENQRFYQLLKEVKEHIDKGVADSYYAYNLLEKFILFDNTRDQSVIDIEISKYEAVSQLDEFKKNIKMLSIQLQRYKPSEWNMFFQLAMDIS